MPGAFAIVMVTLWVKRGSSDVVGTKPAILGGRRATEYCSFSFVSAWVTNPRQIFASKRKEEIKLTEQENRGNENDCFDPFGTKSSPSRVRLPGSPAVASSAPVFVSPFGPSGTVTVLCGQNTALATFETNVLLLRRAANSSAACEPSAMVRRRHNLGALENMSSACESVPWRVRNNGMGELIANVN